MTKLIKYLLVLLAVAFSVNAGFAQTRSYASVIRAATDSVTGFMKKNHIAGAAVTVSVNGKIVWSEGFGFADLEQRVSVDPSRTKFRIASISKAMTATGLAVLYDQGKIYLDSSVHFYVPAFPKKKYRPSVRQLAGHLAGIRHYTGDEFFIAKHYGSVLEGLRVFQDDSLQSKPGTKFLYSTYSFVLLSAVVEKAAGQPFTTFMRDHVWGPLQLNNTMPDFIDSLILNRGRYYDIGQTGWVNSPSVDNSYKWAGGGFLSTSEDVAKFANPWVQPGFLKKQTIELFTTSQKLANGSETGYGLGWGSGKTKSGHPWFGHSGGAVGGSSNLVIFPKEKIVVAILTNVSGGQVHSVTFAVGELFMP